MKTFLAIAMALAAASAAWAEDDGESGAEQVVIYNWSDYIPQDVLDDFSRDSGIKVICHTFESNEEMFARLQGAGGGAYDVVIPSNYLLGKMRLQRWLSPLDHSLLPNIDNLDPKMLNQPYDPGNQYSIPYMWGVTGLVYNSAHINARNIESWADLRRPQYRRRIFLNDDLRDNFSIALKALGFSANSTRRREVEQAYEFLRDLNSEIGPVAEAVEGLVSGSIWLSPLWNGDYLLARENNPNLRFVFPREGVVRWVDNFVIMEASANKANAHAFINYMLRPQVAKRCVEEYMYSSPNLAALALLPPELREDPVLTPAEGDLENAELQEDIGSYETVYEQLWNELISGRD
jgi:spermidine/putrescine transport system substrate-binding protein